MHSAQAQSERVTE